MKDIDNIEDWYRDELNSYQVEPDKNGWNSLSEDLDTSTPLTDNNISEWYKKEAAKLEERPDFSVWDKLSTKLDTSSVWEQLTMSLDRYELLLWWKNMAIKGSATLLLLLGSYFTYNNFNNEDSFTENEHLLNNKEHNYGFTSLLGAKNNSPIFFRPTYIYIANNNNNRFSDSTPTKKHNTQSKIAKAVNSAKQNIILSTPEENSTKKLYASAKKINFYPSISVKNLNILKSNTNNKTLTKTNYKFISEKDILLAHESSEFLVKKEKNKIRFNQRKFLSHSSHGMQTKRLYAGANIGLKKQGMITQLKDDSPLKPYKQNNLLDFGTNFGGVLGIIISDNLNIETNINIHSTSGYKRAFSTEGNSFEENLNLNYSSINLLAKKMNNRSTFDNRIYSTNFFGGGYVSYLRAATSDINGATKNLEEYNKTDFGIVLGIEQDRYITKTLVITPGIRYNQGLANITTKNSAFESARSFSFEFNLGVKYIFNKQGR